MGETLQTRYAIGDRVWTVHKRAEKLKATCRFCRGRPLTVEGPSGQRERVQCPRCDGRGEITLAVAPVWAVDSRTLTIGQVRVTKCGGEVVEEYMAEETGVGSGALYGLDRLHASRELAEAAAAVLTEQRAEREEGRAWSPDYSEYGAAKGFLDHRDAYEHEPEHVEAAEQVVAAYERAQRGEG